MDILNAVYLNTADWAYEAAVLIHDEITGCVNKKGNCTILLTGGRSSMKIYQAWSRLPGFNKIRHVNFYFGDERCVPRNHADSNYALVMKNLFPNGVPCACNIYGINVQGLDPAVAAKKYSEILPFEIDLLLLSLGDDGHIASIFPGSKLLSEFDSRVLPVSEPSIRHNRISITPAVLKEAEKVYIFAVGKEKQKMLCRVLSSPENERILPAQLVLNALWLIAG
jgi:6-phosphogluconolactonase